MAIDRKGRMAAVTNYREPSQQKANLKSRGFLVTDYLFGEDPPQAYLSALSDRVEEYDGFNLFAGDASLLYFYSSYIKEPMQMEPGVHGISNGDLDYPWPKVTKGKQALTEIVDSNNEIESGSLFNLLLDREVPDDNLLPDAGMGVKLERMLAPIFVTGADYGTRSSTVLIVDQDGGVYFAERNFDPYGNEQEVVDYEFQIESR